MRKGVLILFVVLALACTGHRAHAQFDYYISGGEVTIERYTGPGGVGRGDPRHEEWSSCHQNWRRCIRRFGKNRAGLPETAFYSKTTGGVLQIEYSRMKAVLRSR